MKKVRRAKPLSGTSGIEDKQSRELVLKWSFRFFNISR